MPVISALGQLRQENCHKHKASLGDRVKPGLIKPKPVGGSVANRVSHTSLATRVRSPGPLVERENPLL